MNTKAVTCHHTDGTTSTFDVPADAWFLRRSDDRAWHQVIALDDEGGETTVAAFTDVRAIGFAPSAPGEPFAKTQAPRNGPEGTPIADETQKGVYGVVGDWRCGIAVIYIDHASDLGPPGEKQTVRPDPPVGARVRIEVVD